MTTAMFTLTTAESKRLIAKAVIQLPEVKKALKEHTLIVAGGITNAYIVEELTGKEIAKEKYTAGIVTQGVQCITPAEERIAPFVFEKGQVVEKSWVQAVDEFGPKDVFIKGANAVDQEGVAGVLTADPFGGTIGKAIGIIFARGSKLIMPVGLEKMVPSVKAGLGFGGIGSYDYCLGKPAGLFPVLGGKLITELEALKTLFNVKAICLASGGVSGSEGAVTIALEGETEQVKGAFELVKSIKGEPNLKASKQACKCGAPCDRF